MAATLLLALLALPTEARGGELRVPADYATIQAAIDDAVAGDEVLVAPGTWLGPIDFQGKAIAVRSETGPVRTVIDGGGAPLYVVTFASGEGANSLLEGFTITGGLGPQTGGTGLAGGGVLVRDSSPVLADLVVQGNTGLEGGGMHIENGAPSIVDSTFLDDEAHQGGGLFAIVSAPRLEGLVFEGNRAVYGGGGLALLGGTLQMRSVVLTANSADSFGGGMLLNTVNADVSELVAQGNGEAEFLPNGSSIFGTFGGGGLYATNSHGRIDRAVFRENIAASGGGVYIAGNTTLEVINSLIVENESGIWGGGIYLNDASPSITNCTVANNFPGGLFTTYAAFPTVRNSIFVDNDAEHFENVDVYGNGVANLAFCLIGDPVLAGATLGDGMLLGNPGLDSSSYEPLAGSQVIDSGDNSALPVRVKVDLFGRHRYVDDRATADTGAGLSPIIDLGAIEYVPPPPVLFRRL